MTLWACKGEQVFFLAYFGIEPTCHVPPWPIQSHVAHWMTACCFLGYRINPGCYKLGFDPVWRLSGRFFWGASCEILFYPVVGSMSMSQTTGCCILHFSLKLLHFLHTLHTANCMCPQNPFLLCLTAMLLCRLVGQCWCVQGCCLAPRHWPQPSPCGLGLSRWALTRSCIRYGQQEAIETWVRLRTPVNVLACASVTSMQPAVLCRAGVACGIPCCRFIGHLWSGGCRCQPWQGRPECRAWGMDPAGVQFDALLIYKMGAAFPLCFRAPWLPCRQRIPRLCHWWKCTICNPLPSVARPQSFYVQSQLCHVWNMRKQTEMSTRHLWWAAQRQPLKIASGAWQWPPKTKCVMNWCLLSCRSATASCSLAWVWEAHLHWYCWLQTPCGPAPSRR